MPGMGQRHARREQHGDRQKQTKYRSRHGSLLETSRSGGTGDRLFRFCLSYGFRRMVVNRTFRHLSSSARIPRQALTYIKIDQWFVLDNFQCFTKS